MLFPPLMAAPATTRLCVKLSTAVRSRFKNLSSGFFSGTGNRACQALAAAKKRQRGVLSKKSNRKVDHVQNTLPKNG